MAIDDFAIMTEGHDVTPQTSGTVQDITVEDGDTIKIEAGP